TKKCEWLWCRVKGKIKMLRVGKKRVLGTTSLGFRVPARLYHVRVVDHYRKN
ncbi:unnamed protein product, partial [Sphenostylis stenocarpa]